MSKREERSDEKDNVQGSCFFSTLNTIMKMQSNAELPMFKGVIPDTIPLLIYVGHDLFRASGNDGLNTFNTIYFRLEELHPSYMEFSLLCPVDEEGNYTLKEEIPYGLIKMDISIKISPKRVYAIQCLNPKLVNREIIIIEQKF